MNDAISPKIGLALSGGGSRAMAFHLGCLRALNQLGLLDRIDVLSTVSGGSVIGERWFSEDETVILRLQITQRDVALHVFREQHHRGA